VTTAAPLILTSEVVERLHRLRAFAARRPVDVTVVMEMMKSPGPRAAHKKQMTAQTVAIPGPWPFFVTFSIETNHPGGTMRHMSMSIMREGRVPHPAALWLVAAELGFSGGLASCQSWPENLSDGGAAINVVQPVSVGAGGTA
jgi:hypothetical protein